MSHKTAAKYAFTLPNRLTYKKIINPGDVDSLLVKPTFLTGFRDYMSRMAAMQNPTDYREKPHQLPVSFDKGYMVLTINGIEYMVTSTAASQLASMLLPSRFWRGLKELCALSDEGSRLATKVWAEFSDSHDLVPHRIRTVRAQVQTGDIQLVVRSVHSLDYSVYSNLEFTTDLINNSGEFQDMPVVSAHIMDNVMRVRVVALNMMQTVMGQINSNVLSVQPVPMLEMWNSETGCRKTGLRAGIFLLKDSLALGHWDDRAEYSWIHRGDPARIARGVQQAVKNSLDRATEVIEAYRQADMIRIEDPEAWIRNYLKGTLSEEVIDRSVNELSGDKLADAVCAVIKTAQSSQDVLAQEEIEKQASKMMQAGVKAAVNNFLEDK